MRAEGVAAKTRNFPAKNCELLQNDEGVHKLEGGGCDAKGRNLLHQGRTTSLLLLPLFFSCSYHSTLCFDCAIGDLVLS